jgi:nicotinamide mononucleotide adenylyltransferase
MRAPAELSCVTGRFQPVHDQHLELFEIALAESAHLVVAVTNPDSGSLFESAASTHRHRPTDNPFTYFERVRLLDAALTGAGLRDRTTIVPFDLGAPARWPEYVPLAARHFVRVYSEWEATKARLLKDAGYEVVVLDGDMEGRRSGSDIRACLRAGGDWEPLVPPALLHQLRGHPICGATAQTREEQR